MSLLGTKIKRKNGWVGGWRILGEMKEIVIE